MLESLMDVIFNCQQIYSAALRLLNFKDQDAVKRLNLNYCIFIMVFFLFFFSSTLVVSELHSSCFLNNIEYETHNDEGLYA